MEQAGGGVPERFVQELAVVLSGHQEREIARSFEAGRLAYNALLAESLRRLDLLRESRAYCRARAMPRGPARTAAFRSLRARFGFRRYDLFHWSIAKVNRTWLGAHLDSATVRSLAERAFRSAERHALGRAGRPRFKRKGELSSLEGCSNQASIRYRDGQVIWGRRRYALKLDPSDARIAHALASPICRVRLVRRHLGPRSRYFAQLVCAGTPYHDPAMTIGDGVIGIDPGPRTFALVSERVAAQVDLATPQVHKLRRLRRALDRSRGATNPKRYTADGPVRRGGGPRWIRSVHYRKLQAKLRDAARRARARRRNEAGRAANAILRQASELRIERNSYRSFQRHFGRSVGAAAPGAFIARLAQRARLLGAKVVLLPACLAASQRCVCGARRKKALAERVHRCPDCGAGPVQRDVFSAWLLTQATSDPEGSSWRLDAGRLKRAWPGARLRLPTASSPLSLGEFLSLLGEQQAARAGVCAIRPAPGIERLVGVARARRGEVRDGVAAQSARARKSRAGRGPADDDALGHRFSAVS